MKKKVKRIACMILCGLMLWTLAGCAEQTPRTPDRNAVGKIAQGPIIIAAVKSDGGVETAGFTVRAGYEQYAARFWKDIRQLDAGTTHIAGVKKDGTVVAAGNSHEGQCEVGEWTNVKQIAAGSGITVALLEDGTIISTDAERAEELAAATDVMAIACGTLGESIYALKEDGTVEAYTAEEELKEGVKDWKNIKQIDGGLWYVVGLTEEGTVMFASVDKNVDKCGRGDVEDWTDIAYVAAGEYRTWGIKTDGTVISTEFYDPDQSLGKMPDFAETKEWTDIVALEASSRLVVGLRADGQVLLSGHLESPAMAKAAGGKNVKDWTV